jgi:purine-cytosine permease-like protein
MDKPALTWRDLASIEVGGAICLPVIMVGYQLCHQYGLASALLGIGAGNLLLFILACASCWISLEKRKTTAENALVYFGPYGVRLFALSLLIAKTCWFALQLNMMTQALQPLLPESEVLGVALNLFLGCAILVCGLLGIRSISRFSAYSLPILISTMLVSLYLVKDHPAAIGPQALSAAGISLIIAAAITAVIDMPTYYRHARTIKDGLVGSAILTLIALPLIEGVGVYLAYHQTGDQLILGLSGSGNRLWNVWMALFLILAGWTTNNMNLYTASNCLIPLLSKSSERMRALIVGILGTGLSLLQLLNHFTYVLQILGIFVGSMGCVVITCFTLKKLLPSKESKLGVNIAAWGAGVAAGFLSLLHVVNLTGIPLVDSCLAASGAALIGVLCCRNQEACEEVVS